MEKEGWSFRGKVTPPFEAFCIGYECVLVQREFFEIIAAFKFFGDVFAQLPAGCQIFRTGCGFYFHLRAD
jgi:hypothetical protein